MEAPLINENQASISDEQRAKLQADVGHGKDWLQETGPTDADCQKSNVSPIPTTTPVKKGGAVPVFLVPFGKRLATLMIALFAIGVANYGSFHMMDYPIFLVTHKEIRKRPGVNAFFDFCGQQLKSVLLRGMMGDALG